MLPNPPGVAGAPKTAPGVLGVPKAAPGDAGTPKAPPGDPNAFPGVAPVPNAGVGIEGFAKPAQNVVGEHADHLGDLAFRMHGQKHRTSSPDNRNNNDDNDNAFQLLMS